MNKFLFVAALAAVACCAALVQADIAAEVAELSNGSFQKNLQHFSRLVENAQKEQPYKPKPRPQVGGGNFLKNLQHFSRLAEDGAADKPLAPPERPEVPDEAHGSFKNSLHHFQKLIEDEKQAARKEKNIKHTVGRRRHMSEEGEEEEAQRPELVEAGEHEQKADEGDEHRHEEGAAAAAPSDEQGAGLAKLLSR